MDDLRRLSVVSDDEFENMVKGLKQKFEKTAITMNDPAGGSIRATLKQLQDERERRRQLILGEQMQKLAKLSQDEELIYQSGFVAAFRDQMIKVKPGMNGSSIPVHRAILAMRSEIFKNVLDSDECKAAPADDTITLFELNQEELESLLALLYCGRLPKEKMEKHVYTLSLAAHKYNISYLQKYCELHLLKNLNKSNALDVLNLTDHVYPMLKEITLDFIVKNMNDVVLSSVGYDELLVNNPHLSLQIIKALMMERDICIRMVKWISRPLHGFV